MPHHHHMICTTCGSVANFDIPELLEREIDGCSSKLDYEHGFSTKSHSMDLYGTCQNC